MTVFDITTGQALDAESEMGALVTHVGAISTANYRRMIRDAVRAQKRRTAADGYATGSVPLGHKLEGERKAKRITIDPKGARLVREIVSLYARGMTPVQIARSLNARGIVSPKAKNGAAAGSRTRSGSCSSATCIAVAW